MYLTPHDKWKYLPLESVIDHYIGGDWGKDENYQDEQYCLVQCIRGAEYKKWNEDKGHTASLRKVKKSTLLNRELKEGDILVEISGGGPEQPVGRTVLIDKSVLAFNSHIPKVCSNFLRLIRPGQAIFPKFLNLYLNIFYNSGEIVKYQAGSNNLRNLKFNDFLKILIPVPSIEDQKIIVSKVDELFSELDKGVESLRTAQQQLRVYRQSVLKWAFEGRLTNDNVKDGELPKGWKWLTLNDIGKWTGGGTPSKAKSHFWENGQVLWVTPKDMKAPIILGSQDKITEESIKESSAKWIKKDSILFVVRSGIIRRLLPIAIAGDDLTTNQDLQSLTLSDVLPKYVYWFCIGHEQAIRDLCAKDGTTVDNIDVPKLKSYPICICHNEEQLRIVEEIENRLSVADKLGEMINQSLQQVEALRQSILKKAFEGKLVSQKEVKTYKPKSEYFHQAQILGFINKYSKEKGISHGEMTIAKYAYLADKIYGIPTFYNFQRWHLGPYPPEMKKAIKNAKYFTQKKGVIELANEDVLLKYNNPYKEQVKAAVDELAETFLKYPAEERAYKTELLATVCKVIEDTGSTDLSAVRRSMSEWPVELPGSKYKTKAEKFSEGDTKSCLNFIKDRGWDTKLTNLSAANN